MPTDNFDIDTLLHFQPPQYLCYKCYALFPSIYNWIDRDAGRCACPVCGVKYIPSDQFGLWQVGKFLQAQKLTLDYGDLIGHSRSLATVASKAREHLRSNATNEHPWRSYPPMRALLSALSVSTQFVHFTTFGMSHMLLGALKLAAEWTTIRGIVSNVEGSLLDELRNYPGESPNLEIKIFERKGRPETWDNTPHQKIIIIDGLLAFKGSANLTVSGWRKAEQGRDVIEFVTDVKEVIEQNNRFFSPIWAEFSEQSEVDMEVIPF